MIEACLQLIYVKMRDKDEYKPALARREPDDTFTIIKEAVADQAEGLLEFREGQRVVCDHKPMQDPNNNARESWVAVAASSTP